MTPLERKGKNMYKIILALGILSFITISCDTFDQESMPITYSEIDKALWVKATTYLWTLEEEAAQRLPDESEELVLLGKTLFLDTNLSADGTVSCNSCHGLDTYGVDNKVVSDGVYGRKGTRNSPTIFNAALQLSQFWDGRAKDLEEQALGPLYTAHEMGLSGKEELIDKIMENEEIYAPMFDAAYGDVEAISEENVLKAIGAFQRTLITPSKFDQYLAGEMHVLTEQEKMGLEKFIDLGCSPCHSGSTIGGNMYHRFALQSYYTDFTGSLKEDMGRYDVTKKKEDKYVFKVPSLRNIEKTAPYFHDGSIASLDSAIWVMGQAQMNTPLTGEDIQDLKAFLLTLTAEVMDIKE